MTVEWRAFVRRLADPRMMAAAVPHFSQLLGRSARRRVTQALPPQFKSAHIPPYTASHFPLPAAPPLLTSLPATTVQAAIRRVPVPETLRLPSRVVSATAVDWHVRFADPEDTAALHRWRWLLAPLDDGIDEAVTEWGLRLATDWCQSGPRDRAHLAWDAYTASERIANFLLFAAATCPSLEHTSDVWRSLLSEVHETAYHVASRLEYHGERTNNHLLNNARALYLAGRLLSVAPLADLGRTILLRETPRMFTPDGFIREGSSHYHLLLTRTYLEVLWAAEATGDSRTYDALVESVRRMVERARFLVVTTSSPVMPLIGDISPDCEPEWLLAMPWSRPARAIAPAAVPASLSPVRGWAALWEQSFPSVHGDPPRRGLEMWRASGWYRFDDEALTVFWRAEPNGALPEVASHGHNDVGSFVAFWKGRPLLVDAGRSTYRADVLGEYGLSADAHNTVVIDAHEPFVLHRRHLFPRRYRDARVDVRTTLDGAGVVLTVAHDGYSRLGQGIRIERSFTCGGATLAIEDRISGVGVHDVRTRFHLAPGASATVDTGTVRIASERGAHVLTAQPSGSRIEVASGRLEPRPAGWVSTRYGHAEAAAEVSFTSRVTLPAVFNYRLETL